MPLTENEELWYKNQIKKYDPKGEYIVIDDSTGLITYTSKLKSDEKKIKEKNPEEYVHTVCVKNIMIADIVHVYMIVFMRILRMTIEIKNNFYRKIVSSLNMAYYR